MKCKVDFYFENSCTNKAQQLLRTISEELHPLLTVSPAPTPFPPMHTETVSVHRLPKVLFRMFGTQSKGKLLEY